MLKKIKKLFNLRSAITGRFVKSGDQETTVKERRADNTVRIIKRYEDGASLEIIVKRGVKIPIGSKVVSIEVK